MKFCSLEAIQSPVFYDNSRDRLKHLPSLFLHPPIHLLGKYAI